jgi:hypothetical protein
MEFSKQFINNIILSALDFRKSCPEVVKLKTKYDSIQQGIEHFKNAIAYEAHQSMQEQITDYSEPLLSCVDLDTKCPGVITKYVSDSEVTVTYIDGSEREYFNIYDLKLFASPIPFDRHINALSLCSPNKFIESALLQGEESKITVFELKEILRSNNLKISGLKQDLVSRVNDNFVFPNINLYHGPPGTGKTYTILKKLNLMLEKLPDNHRFLICAPSNVGTINLYTRARDSGIQCTLVMRDDKIPDGTLITDEERELWDSKKARVVFSTVSGRSGSILRKQEFHTIIVDEAAQCQESWGWGLLRSEVVNLIMAGDPHQLPAQVSDTGKELGHGISLMERLMSIGYKSTLLNVQRRMHPQIAQFPNNAFYDGKLETEFTESEFYSIKPYEIIGINSAEERKGTSYVNEIEAKVVVSLANKLKQTYSDTIIISPYKGQIELLKKLDPSLVIHTVDSFQGKEADAIILTTVRSGKSVGFWQDSRRLNVALTRAKHVLRIVGSVSTWKQSNSIMTSLANYASNGNYIKSLSPLELIQLNIELTLNDIREYTKTTLWSNPIIENRAINNAKCDKQLENALAKGIAKLCSGMKHKTNNVLNTLNISNISIDWSVILNESTKELKLKFHNVRYSGTDMQITVEVSKLLEKFGPEWNAICMYENGPKTLEELPFKGKRPPPPKVEIPRDRFKERMNAQKLVSSFRR